MVGMVRPEITTLGRDSSLLEGVLLAVVVDAVAGTGTVLVALYGGRSGIFNGKAPITATAVKRAPSLTPASTNRKQKKNHEVIVVVHPQSPMWSLSWCFEIYSPKRSVDLATLSRARATII